MVEMSEGLPTTLDNGSGDEEEQEEEDEEEERMPLLKRPLRADDRKTRKQRRREREAKEAVSGVSMKLAQTGRNSSVVLHPSAILILAKLNVLRSVIVQVPQCYSTGTLSYITIPT